VAATSKERRSREKKVGSDLATIGSDNTVDKSVNRTQLQLIIAGLTDGVIIIEPDQTIAWANDAALAMHGVDAIETLGSTVDEYRRNFQLQYRNNHRVEDGRNPIERVVGGERFDDVVVEVSRAGGSKPEWVHRIRSLVINDEKGVPDCLVLILKDATDSFQAEERFQKTFAANPAPAIICRLSDLRYVKVNQGFMEMTGYSKEELLGRSTYEIDLMKDAERRSMAIERLSLGETIPQMEACIEIAGGATKWVIVAGQPLEIGDEACMLFTFADLERQKKAEASLRQSEERFEKAFRSSPVATLLLKASDLTFVAVNESFAKILGRAEIDVIGRRIDEIDLWVKEEQLLRFRSKAVQSGAVAGSEECLRRADGENLDCLVSAVSISVADHACLLCTIIDITDRKRSERDLVAAIDKVMADTSWFSSSLIQKLAELRTTSSGDKEENELDSLTRREKEMLRFICQGRTDLRIAEALHLSQNTVRNHIASLYRKLQVHNRTEAALWGHAHGFLPEPATTAPRSAK
jgi:PAS domain S-box-containing protein